MPGFAHEPFGNVRETFEKSLTEELGAAFCVTVGGEVVVDLWGGFADAARTRPWTEDTIVNVYSATKPVTALTALLLADRDRLDVHAPVARHWPEFAAGGKADITVAQLLGHAAGLSGWAETLTTEDLFDWPRATALLAAQEPLWEPGSRPGYHVATFGYLVGEVVRRIDGRTVGTLLREEIAGPIGADFHIGLPASEDHRVAELTPPETPAFSGADLTPLQDNAAHNPPIPVEITATRAWRGAEIPAANGTGNARSLALLLGVLANGGEVRGRRILSEAGSRRALAEQIEGQDLILDMPIRYGLGGAIGSAFMPSPHTVYWGGAGGSLVIADLDTRASFAYVPNRMSGGTADMRGMVLAMEAWQSLGLL